MATSDDLDWDDLRYLLRAASAATPAGAARAMGVEHTTIGGRLASLERGLGAALVLRSPEGLKLTSLGERVLPLVENVERAVPRSGAISDDDLVIRKLAESVCLVYRREVKLSDQVRAVIDFIIGVMQEAAPRMGGHHPAP